MRPAVSAACLCACFSSAVLFSGCHPPANAKGTNTSGTTINFAGGITYSPSPAIADQQTAISFTLVDNSTTATTVNNVPWTVAMTNQSTGVVTTNYASGIIPTIAPSGTASASFNVQLHAGTYLFTVTIDPHDSTGFADGSDQSQTLDITFVPSGTG